MRINFKDPNIYYITVPIFVGFWMILAVFVFYPASIRSWEESQKDFESIENQIKQLATLQPKRLEYEVDEKAKPEVFDFTKTVTAFSKKFAIPDSNYTLNVRRESKRAGKKTRSAAILIKKIDTETFAQFLSELMLQWPDLKCDTLSIEKVKNTKNDWKINLSMTYYYE